LAWEISLVNGATLPLLEMERLVGQPSLFTSTDSSSELALLQVEQEQEGENFTLASMTKEEPSPLMATSIR
jgi:hypothetical protein